MHARGRRCAQDASRWLLVLEYVLSLVGNLVAVAAVYCAWTSSAGLGTAAWLVGAWWLTGAAWLLGRSSGGRLLGALGPKSLELQELCQQSHSPSLLTHSTSVALLLPLGGAFPTWSLMRLAAPVASAVPWPSMWLCGDACRAVV